MAGWNDYHADWTTSDDLVLASDAVLAACIAAGRERWVGSGGLGPEWDGKYILLKTREQAWSELLSDLETMLPSYANQTDNGGNWNDQPSIPTWTTATIATAADLDEWPSLSRLDSHSAELPWSVRKVIDLMLWARPAAPGRQNSSKSASFVSSGWAAAVSIFNAAAFSAFSPNSGSFDVDHTAYLRSGQFFIRRTRIRWPGGSSVRPGPSADSLSYSLQSYVSLLKPGTPFGVDTAIYEDNDYNVAEDNFALMFTAPGLDSGYYDDDIIINDIGNNSVSEPADKVIRGFRTEPGAGSLWYFIFKFDVTGGFQFVA